MSEKPDTEKFWISTVGSGFMRWVSPDVAERDAAEKARQSPGVEYYILEMTKVYYQPPLIIADCEPPPDTAAADGA